MKSISMVGRVETGKSGDRVKRVSIARRNGDGDGDGNFCTNPVDNQVWHKHACKCGFMGLFEKFHAAQYRIVSVFFGMLETSESYR